LNLSLIKKLSLGFLMAVIGSILITSFISNYMVGKKFNQYLVDQHETEVSKVIKVVEGLYNEQNGFSNSEKDEIQRYAVLQELFIEISDTKGNVVYSSGNTYLQHKDMMGGMMGSMMSGAFKMQSGEYKEETHPLVKGNKNIGTMVVGYFSTSYFTTAAMNFKMTLNHSLILSALIALIFGLIISIILSRQLSFPLIKITKTANEMADGNLGVRSKLNTNTKEIAELSNSINYLAETLQQQEVLRKRLTSDMAHEIRTPLTTLKTHVEALLDGVWEPTQERFESFYEEIERLTKLVDNLRNLAKLEQANLNLNKTKFSLSDELKKIILSFEPLYSKENFKILSNITPDINVVMDKDKLKQIMYNLLSNSYKYLNEGGQVIVTLKNEADNIIIRVKDNGMGIPEKDLPYIFERFYRSDVSRNKTTGGSGIGLTITKAIVEAHNGSI
jgi:two-component system, OmpR family, sensor histidine kinase BaeS